jgi:hypothetical protein
VARNRAILDALLSRLQRRARRVVRRNPRQVPAGHRAVAVRNGCASRGTARTCALPVRGEGHQQVGTVPQAGARRGGSNTASLRSGSRCSPPSSPTRISLPSAPSRTSMRNFAVLRLDHRLRRAGEARKKVA